MKLHDAPFHAHPAISSGNVFNYPELPFIFNNNLTVVFAPIQIALADHLKFRSRACWVATEVIRVRIDVVDHGFFTSKGSIAAIRSPMILSVPRT